MTRSRTSEALAAFHELGVLLYPELPVKFAAAPHEKAFAVLHRAERPEVVTRAARAISQTLRRAGDLSAGRTIISKLHADWAARLAKASTTGDLAEAIHGLASLDMDVAHAAVASLEDLLLSRVHRGLSQQPQSAVELLRAIERALPGLGRSLVERLQLRRAAWDAAMEQIAFEQDPRFQGTTFYKLAALGGMPKERVRRRIFEQWLRRIVTVNSPIGVVSLLRMFAAWDMAWAQEAAQHLSAHRLAMRMGAAAVHDLVGAEELVGALVAVDAESTAMRILHSLKGVEQIPRLLGLQGAARLVAGLREWDPEFGAALSGESCAFAVESISDNFVLDDVSLWLEIGWTARNARLYGQSLSIQHAPWHFALSHPPQVTLWGAGWLDPCSWVSVALDGGFTDIQEVRAKYRPWAAAAILTVASELGNVGALLDRDPEVWLSALVATPYHLDALLHVALARRGPLLEFVRKNLSSVNVMVGAPEQRLHPARARSMHSLARIEALREPSVSL